MNDRLEDDLSHKGVHPLILIGTLSFFSVILLYYFAPEDNSVSLPSPYSGRYMWTPLIPFLITISISAFCISGILDILTNKTLIFAVNCIFFLILLSPQFAEWTPIESDGWWFIQISERYSEYGNDGTELYLSRMITLIPLDLFSKIFPEYIPMISSILGLLISSLWIILTVDSVNDHPLSKRLLVPIFLIISLLMITWWSPFQYTAQMLSLLFFVYVMRNISDLGINNSLIFCLIVIPATHLQSPMIICSILVVEGFLRTRNSLNAINCFFILGTSFIIWNFTIGAESFLILIPDLISNHINIWNMLISLFLVTSLLRFNLSKKGVREVDIWGGRNGISNLSIVIGCILILPIMYIGDQKIGAARLVPRLLIYSMVPICYWLLIFASYIDGKVRNLDIEKNKFFIVFVIFSLLGGSLAGVGHVNYSSRTLMIPMETLDCWEMTEDAGIVGLMNGNFSEQRGYVLHSPVMLSNADEDHFWYFVHLGDESRASTIDFTYYSAILQTADINSDDLIKNKLPHDIFETWSLAGEVPGGCKFWVNPQDLKYLDSSLNWDST